MNLPLYTAMFACSLVFFALAAALIVICKSRSERQDELRYGRMRPTNYEHPFRAPPLSDAWDASYPPGRPEAFTAVQGATH